MPSFEILCGGVRGEVGSNRSFWLSCVDIEIVAQRPSLKEMIYAMKDVWLNSKSVI
jgi:hypothetical protein